MRAVFLALAFGWLCWPSGAAASPLLELIGGQSGMGGLQARATASGASASYFNPSLLTDAPAGLTVSALVLRSEIRISLDAREAGHDVPDGVANAGHADRSRFAGVPIATDLLQHGKAAGSFTPALTARPRQGAGTGHQTLSYEAIGLVVKLYRQRLSVGFFGLIPNKNLLVLRSFYSDEREQYMSNSLHPELYSDRLNSLSLAFAAGLKLTDTLSIGVGATATISAGAEAPVFVADAGRLQDILLDTNVKGKVSFAPHVGVSYRPLKRLQLTSTLHAPQKVAVDAKFKFLLASGVEQGSSVKFVHDWQPWQLGGGAAWALSQNSQRSWSAVGSLLYGRWSEYVDRHGERPSGPFKWKDTLAGSGGLRFVGEQVGLGLDFQYRPSPVPLQTGRTNYSDNDRLGLNLSTEYRFVGLDTRMRIGATLQGYWLLLRHQRKLPTPTNAQGINRTPNLVWDEVPDDAQISGSALAGAAGLQTNNPGWPGFSSSGWIASGGLNFTAEL